MRYSSSVGFTFALPPSLGRESLRPIARHIADLLSNFGFGTVWPVASYDQLERALLGGDAHAAWAPPVVCARMESAGGAVAYRAVRMGATSYRSALLCRSERSIDLKRLGDLSGLAPIRAAWVDRRSAAGCVMPRRLLRERGADLATALDEEFLGSYSACFDAVLGGDADLTASYVGRRGSGYVDLLGPRAADLRVLAWTDEIPNDGVAVSPALPPALAAEVSGALAAAFAGPTSRDDLALALDADAFDEPEPGCYEPARALLCDDPPPLVRRPRPSRARPHALRAVQARIRRLGTAV